MKAEEVWEDKKGLQWEGPQRKTQGWTPPTLPFQGLS